MHTVDKLKERIGRREYVVGVVGLGYVGLPLALQFARAGFSVLGFDIDPDKVRRLNSGESYFQHLSVAPIAEMVQAGRLSATSNMERLGEPDAIIICVPTPLGKHREPDLQYVLSTTEVVADHLRPGQLVSLESTTYPGTTEEVVLPRLAARGLQVGSGFFLAFSPEREDPGNAEFTTATIPKVVGGVTSACLDVACALYGQAIAKVVPVSSPAVAEAAKVLENVYRSVNIALVNELKMVFSKMNIDIWEVIETAKTKPFGFQPFYPGPGLGGHCVPIDPFYLTWKAREYGMTTRFIELAGEINSAMPLYVVNKVTDALNRRGRALRGSRILVLGVAYKRDVADLREAPALEIIHILLEKGAFVDYSDPFFPALPTVRRHNLHMSSVPLSPESLQQYDVAVIATDHSDFPYKTIHSHSSLIVDTRNALRARSLSGHHVVLA